MANIKELVPFILQWESEAFTNNKADKGGPTKMGVTLVTWKSVGYDKDGDKDIDVDDLKLITKEDYERVARIYWDRWQADKIKNQSVANMLVDWVWLSGSWGIKLPQRLLQVAQDGKVGPITLAAVNKQDPKTFFTRLYNARVAFIEDLIRKDNSQKKWKNGWMNRLNAIKFKP